LRICFMKKVRDVSVLVVGLVAMLPVMANGQDLGPQPPMGAPPGYVQPAPTAQIAPPPAEAAPAPPEGSLTEAGGGTPVGQPQAYTQEQIDQLVAPIALYPDALVAQILMASTYPLEVVEAARWRQQPENAQLQGAGLEQALEQQPWDPSVKSLVPFPQVLSMMDGNLQWTEQLGDAFLASQPAVMGEVQNLRQKAEAAGNLKSTPQQAVVQQQGDIVIQPVNPQVVYVPYYNPMVVYGAWPWVAYPPYYFVEPPGYVAFGLFGFGVGIAVADWFWGWGHWDWGHHEMFVDPHRFAFLNHGVAPHFAGGAWAHDPAHRHGVPYRNAAVRTRYQGAATAARQNYRGYFNGQSRGSATNANVRTAAAANGSQRSTANFAASRGTTSSETRSFNGTAASRSTAAATHTEASRPATQTRSAPMFESFSRGSDVHAQSARGATSRASMASFSRPAASAAPRSSGGAAAGGRDEHR
jgi:hypothetical protein